MVGGSTDGLARPATQQRARVAEAGRKANPAAVTAHSFSATGPSQRFPWGSLKFQ